MPVVLAHECDLEGRGCSVVVFHFSGMLASLAIQKAECQAAEQGSSPVARVLCKLGATMPFFTE